MNHGYNLAAEVKRVTYLAGATAIKGSNTDAVHLLWDLICMDPKDLKLIEEIIFLFMNTATLFRVAIQVSFLFL